MFGRNFMSPFLVAVASMILLEECRSSGIEPPPNWDCRAAVALDQAGDFRRARAALGRVPQNDDASAWAEGYAAAIEARKRKAAGLLPQLQTKLRRTQRPRTRAQLLFKLGLCQELLGEQVKAMAAYDRSIEAWPSHAQVYVRRGLLREASGNLNGAEDDLRMALELEPAGAVVRLQLGLFLLRAGKGQEVDALVSQLQEREPFYAEILEVYATKHGPGFD